MKRHVLLRREREGRGEKSIKADQLACLTPSFVSHESLSLLASKAAVMVVPLLPPHPTSITPNFGTLMSVLMRSFVETGTTCGQQHQ